MEKNIEIKIKEDRIKRQKQIVFRIFAVLETLLILWIVLSWIEVIHHNNMYYMEGVITTYSKLNFFKLLF